MLGREAEKEEKKIPVSNCTIRRRIHEMSTDIEEIACTSVKKSEMFALYVDESTDIVCRVQLLVFIRYLHDDKTVNNFFKELELSTTGNDIFST